MDKNKETTSSPLPKDLQDLVDKDEEDREIRADFENSWTATRSEDESSGQASSNQLDNVSKTKDQPLDRAEKEKQC
ncbi:hypothetical protein N7517_006146 [Penicillium concentricum]|uniref:Uncharacterized protein n=1 Tax=Penicillium concentricum TaxID=293559 RepID=A0A9W9VC66_9EURO|nr:uncharacterized protein N7517_006146 [Penicillium concentricum]KAJ5374140.1 hypothetical protein N7517_006146 [Penicillium concentricum]